MERKREMDKGGNVRRAFSNANKHKHKHKLFAVFRVRGDLQLRLSEKSNCKKQKLRSLNAVGTKPFSTSQMLSPKLPSELKLPNHVQFFNASNASVPRKLRSATKKRSRESVLLDSEKVKHRKMNGIESPKKDSVKKFKKQRMRVQREGPITKDEEEVAETLYALAGMFSDIASNHISRESLPNNNNNNNSNSVLLDLEVDKASDVLQASATVQGASACCPESSHGEASKISCLNEAVVGQEQLDLPDSAKFLLPSHIRSASPTMNLHTMPVMVKCENNHTVALHESELCLSMGLNMPKQLPISQKEMKADAEFEAARDIDSRQQEHMIKEQEGNDVLALWPGLSLVAPFNQAYLQSSATKKPDWLESAISASRQDLMETSCSSSGRKVSEVAIDKRPWKRCAAHVHISRVIKSLELSKRNASNETELYECHQMRAHEGSKHETPLEVLNIYGMRNGVTSRNHPHEINNVNLQQQCDYGDISQAVTTPVVCDGPQKQNFNFLSLSAGDNNGLKVNNHDYNKIMNRLEPVSKLQMPYFRSPVQQQHHRLIPIPTAQSQYTNTSYLDQLCVAGPQVRLQQPHYYGSPLCGSNCSSTVSNKQEQQRYWGLQQAAEGSRSNVSFNIMRTQYYPNWQSSRHDSSSVSPSQEIFRSKIASISAQQHHLLPPFPDKWTTTPSPFCM